MTRRGSGVQIPHGPHAKKNHKSNSCSYRNHDDCCIGASSVLLRQPQTRFQRSDSQSINCDNQIPLDSSRAHYGKLR